MQAISLKPITNRPPVVIAGLTLLAILGFVGVTRLVNRFAEQQKALARHLYERATTEQQAGKIDLAVEHFRDALAYDRDNYQYQLQFARALRDTGRTQEAEAYLISLWEHAPQDGAVNLALGRLAARQKLLDKTLQYYHNAIYGVWTSKPEENRLNAAFELIDFLIKQNARPQAQGELITLAAEIPPQSELRLRVAGLFAQMQDYEHALAEYQQALKLDHGNAEALAGAGRAAFNLDRFHAAERYLQLASTENATDPDLPRMMQVSHLVLTRDPFRGDISNEERNHRLSSIFDDAGTRLDTCMALQTSNEPYIQAQAAALTPLKTQWDEMSRKLRRIHSSDAVMPDQVMDLVLKIEQQTQFCPSTSEDEALLLLAQNRGAER
jgi:tetratricopeptide (TPR) repeat protein